MKMPVWSRVIIGLGSNMGDRLAALGRALTHISQEAGNLCAVSSLWESEPWGFDADEHFYNLVAVLETVMQPQELMQLFRSVEGRMGRTRNKGGRYESRIIDIDILLWEDRIISLPGLEVPHPKIADRRFVLEPLCEVAPDACHPVTGMTSLEMLAGCEDRSDVRIAGQQL